MLTEVHELFKKKANEIAKPQSKRIVKQSCIDSTRERNVGIVLRCLRLSLNEIRDAVEAMDDEVLSEEAVAGLLSVFPTAEEQRLIRAAPADQKSSLCGSFFSMCTESPDLEIKLRSWLGMCRFEGSFQQLLCNVGCVAQMCESTLSSHHLQQLFWALLSVCNELNKELPNLAGAHGFSLLDLQKFRPFMFSSYCAGAENPLTHNLLSLCLRGIEPEASLQFKHIRDQLQEACKIDLNALNDELRELEGHVQLIRSSSAMKECAAFLQGAEKNLHRLAVAHETMTSASVRFLQYFCSKDCDWAESVAALTQFMIDVVKCLDAR